MNNWEDDQYEDSWLPDCDWNEGPEIKFTLEDEEMEPEPKPLTRPTKGPIYNLPLELLSMIMVAGSCINWRSPCVYGLVCRLWRAALLNAPQAWTNLPLSGVQLHHMDGAKLWLSRAGNAPVHLNNVSSNRLLSFCKNIHSLEYLGGTYDLTLLTLPTLRRMSLPWKFNLQLSFLQKFAPNLRTLDLHDWFDGDATVPVMHISENLSLTIPVHSNIRHLHLALHWSFGIQLMINLRLQLESLCLRYKRPFPPFQIPTSRYEYPRLKRLTVLATIDSRILFHYQDLMPGFIGFINSVITPQLCTLHEQGIQSNTSMDYSLRSTIKEYIAEVPLGKTTGKGPSLSQIPNVRSLKLLTPLPISREYVRQLATQPDLCPKLENLEVYICARPHAMFRSELEIIKKREGFKDLSTPFLPALYWKAPYKFFITPPDCEVP